MSHPYEDPAMPEHLYHAHRAISSTFLRHVLPPGCPAEADWERRHPSFKDEFDLGSVAHELVLHEGAGFKVLEYDDWRTKAAKDARAEARAQGLTALLAKDHARAERMAGKIREHPIAGRLLAPGSGRPEVSVFWRDERTGLECRARIDWWRHDGTLVDVKTTGKDVSARSIAKSVADFRYHQQDAWYRTAVEALTEVLPPFVFVFADSRPPHLVSVVQLDVDDIAAGLDDNRRALDLIAACTEVGDWPGHLDDTEIHTISRPSWARNRGEL